MGPDPNPNPKPSPEPEPPTLHLTTFPTLKYQQQYSGAITPLHTLASIPFSWEKEPGKPFTLAKPSHNNLILELPPRLLNVIERPYNTLGRSVFQSSSFRFLRKKRRSFDVEIRSVGSSPEASLLVDSERGNKGFFGSWRKKNGVNYKGKSEIYGGSFVFPSSLDDGDELGKVERVNNKKTQLGLSQANKSHFWATIFETFKQVIPRGSTKCKKDAL